MIDPRACLFPPGAYADRKSALAYDRTLVAGNIRAGYPTVVYDDGAVTVFGMSIAVDHLREIAARPNVVWVLNATCLR